MWARSFLRNQPKVWVELKEGGQPDIVISIFFLLVGGNFSKFLEEAFMGNIPKELQVGTWSFAK